MSKTVEVDTVTARDIQNDLVRLFDQWLKITRPAYYAFQASQGRRKAILHQAAADFLPLLGDLEHSINWWADQDNRTARDEYALRYRAGRMRAAFLNTDPHDVTFRIIDAPAVR